MRTVASKQTPGDAAVGDLLFGTLGGRIDLAQCRGGLRLLLWLPRITVRSIEMRAADVMTSDVITVREDASVQDAAKFMAERGISAVPVVDRERRVVGIISEGDLLHRAETGTERRRSWWL